jgi:hypothetical protein
MRSTVEWGYTVQALVNIGRVKLADSMGLQLPESLEKEKMWGLVTKYGFFGEEADGERLNQIRKKPEAGAQKAPDNERLATSAEPEEDEDILEEGDDER